MIKLIINRSCKEERIKGDLTYGHEKEIRTLTFFGLKIYKKVLDDEIISTNKTDGPNSRLGFCVKDSKATKTEIRNETN